MRQRSNDKGNSETDGNAAHRQNYPLVRGKAIASIHYSRLMFALTYYSHLPAG